MPVISVIYLLGLIQSLRNIFWPKDKTWEKSHVPDLYTSINHVFDRTITYETDRRQVLALRIPPGQKATGMNHDIDHMVMRQGAWVSCLKLMNLDVKRAVNVLKDCVKIDELRRGCLYRMGEPVGHSTQPVSGDMLVGFCFGYAHAEEHLKNEMAVVGNKLCDMKGLPTEGVVSPVANFLPGIQFGVTTSPVPVGAQTATYLCGILCAIDAYKRIEKLLPGTKSFPALRKKLEREYFKRMWIYGGFIDVMIPSAGIWFKRGYNNDNVVVQALYCCHKFAPSSFSRFFFGSGMVWIWTLSWPWLNGFFSGLLVDRLGLLSKRYMKTCQAYAYELKGIEVAIKSKVKKTAWKWPVKPSLVNVGEFLADEDQEVTKEGPPSYQSTLGQLCYLLWSSKHERKDRA